MVDGRAGPRQALTPQHDGAAPTWYEASARTNPAWPRAQRRQARGCLRHRRRLHGALLRAPSCRARASEPSCWRHGASATVRPAATAGSSAAGTGARSVHSGARARCGAGAAALVAGRGGEGVGARAHRPARDRMRPEARHRHRRPPPASRACPSPVRQRISAPVTATMSWRCSTAPNFAPRLRRRGSTAACSIGGAGHLQPARLCAGPRPGGGRRRRRYL